MTKKHIVFIPCGVLPIPAVRGGAVENLVWQLADLNERHVGYEMTVYSPYDAKAVERSMVYKHTRFSFIRTSGLPNKMLTNGIPCFRDTISGICFCTTSSEI